MLRPDLKLDRFKTSRLFQNRSTRYKTDQPDLKLTCQLTRFKTGRLTVDHDPF